MSLDFAARSTASTTLGTRNRVRALVFRAAAVLWMGWLVTAVASTPLVAQHVPGHLKIVFTSTQHATCPSQPAGACDTISSAAELYVMNRNGSDQTRITFDDVLEYGAAWSPDGTQIAFYSPVTGANGKTRAQIFLAGANGTVQLTGTGPSTDTGGAQFPDWSPDGTKIAFQTPLAAGAARDIYVINVDGTGLTNLTHNTIYADIRPAWSPDGTRIAFQSNRDGNNEIYVVNADGSNPVRLTFDAGADQAPDWSPDGHKIVFESNRDGNFDLWVINADGSQPTQLTNTGGCTQNRDAAWSPDGAKIAFSSDRDFPTDDCSQPERGIPQVWVMDADGTHQTSLTSLPGASNAPAWGWTTD